MIDYRTYELSKKEKWLFVAIGYWCIFFLVYLFFRIPIISAAAGLLVLFILPRYRDHLARVKRQQLGVQFKDMLTSLSASVESGRQMEPALIDAYETLSSIYPADAPIVCELCHIKKAIAENNDSDIRLLSDFAQRSGNEDIRDFVQVYTTCRSTGGDLTEVIAHTSGMMAEKMDIKEQISVITSQKKLEGRIISAMPPAMLLILNLLSPAYISVLYTTMGGRSLMLICLIAMCLGARLMEKLTDIEI